jgi:hypothetical protein
VGEWTCEDLNLGPLPYQLCAPRARSVIRPVCMEFEVASSGPLDAGVAVITAHCLARPALRPERVAPIGVGSRPSYPGVSAAVIAGGCMRSLLNFGAVRCAALGIRLSLRRLLGALTCLRVSGLRDPVCPYSFERRLNS